MISTFIRPSIAQVLSSSLINVTENELGFIVPTNMNGDVQLIGATVVEDHWWFQTDKDFWISLQQLMSQNHPLFPNVTIITHYK